MFMLISGREIDGVCVVITWFMACVCDCNEE